jgi:D-inositol-3-phosphate glycosyltransferase
MESKGVPLKILYSFPARLGAGAVGVAAAQTIRLLAKAGHDVEVFCGAGSELIPGVRATDTRWTGGIYLPQKIVGATLLRLLHDRVLANQIRASAVKPDVLHVWPLSGLWSLAEARRAGVPIVREAPNCHTRYGFEMVARENAKLGLQPHGTHKPNARNLALELAELEASDAVLVPSPFARQTFEDEGVPSAKLELHRYGYDPKVYTGFARPDASAPVVFGFVASCEPRKGLHFALKAWRASGIADRSRFLIVGAFVPGYFEALSDMINHPNVKRIGYVNNLVPIYQEVDVLTLPSVEDGSALVTYEAQAMSCALLVSKAAGAVITEGKEGFVHDCGDVETLATQMRRLVEDRPFLSRLQLAAAKNSPNLTWERGVESLVETYRRRLVAAGGTRAVPAYGYRPAYNA